MHLMNTRWTIRILVTVLLVVFSGAAFAECQGNCLDDCACGGACVYACHHGILQQCTAYPDITYTAFTPDQGVTIPHVTDDGIFRPPTTLL